MSIYTEFRTLVKTIVSKFSPAKHHEFSSKIILGKKNHNFHHPNSKVAVQKNSSQALEVHDTEKGSLFKPCPFNCYSYSLSWPCFFFSRTKTV